MHQVLAVGQGAGGGSSGTFQSGNASITNGATSKAITYPAAYGAGTVPAVTAQIQTPDNTGTIVTCTVDYSTITNTGFTVLFGDAVPASGYYLSWTANG